MRLEEEAGRVLRMNGLTLALAESCTGGLIASMLTDVPGSSEYFLASLVTYDNPSKIALLGVSPDTLATKGAVSEQTAREMALGARRAVGADIGLAVTGIAGPGGGTPGKPVGTVHFALGDGRTTITSRMQFSGDRLAVKRGAARYALEMLVRHLDEH
jgi:nicotinamide-nucleotide amidase